MCLYPKLIKNPKYRINKKNNGNIPEMIDDRAAYVPIGCGKCIECRKQKADNWKIRLYEEVKTDKTGKFVTLTFSDESLIKLWDYCEQKNYSSYNKDNDIATKAVRLFLERYRKHYKKSMKHWLITELGHTGTERIHLHGILFTAVNNKEIERLWSYVGVVLDEIFLRSLCVFLYKQVYLSHAIIQYNRLVIVHLS